MPISNTITHNLSALYTRNAAARERRCLCLISPCPAPHWHIYSSNTDIYGGDDGISVHQDKLREMEEMLLASYAAMTAQ
eukprot:674139-Rhodomonas_salina.1